MPGDKELIRENTVDFVGVNYYHPRRVCHREMPLVSDVFMPDQYSENYMPENCKMNRSRGWEIYEMASQGHKGRLSYKKSAGWFQGLSDANGFSDTF